MNARGLSYCSYFPNYFGFRPVCCVRPLWPAAPRSQPSLNDLDPNFWIFISISLGSSSCFYSFTSVAVMFTLSLRAGVKKWETHHDKKLIWYVMIHFQVTPSAGSLRYKNGSNYRSYVWTYGLLVWKKGLHGMVFVSGQRLSVIVLT